MSKERMPNLSAEISAHTATTSFEQLPAAAMRAAKLSLLDAIGVTLGASGIGEGCRGFVDLARDDGGKAQSTIIGFGNVKVAASAAAFANGAMAHALDFEDSHDASLTHPNAATIPAALAMAEALGGASGRDLLTAVATGSDLVCRLGLALVANPAEFGWYTPAILGAFGATAAAGRLLGLSPAQMLDAYSLTLCQATCSMELRYSPHSMVRAVRDAFAARAGVTAALLASRGVKGFDRPFDGQAGLFALYARGQWDPERLTAGLGHTFHGADVSFKPWPACRGTHSYIDAALQLRAETGVTAEMIDGIVIEVSPVNRMLCEPAEQKRQPQTAIDAKFSLPFVIGTALHHGHVDLDLFVDGALANPEVLTIAGKVRWRVKEDANPSSALRGSMEIRTLRGNVYRKSIDHPKGSLENPLDEAALIRKFKNCARHAAAFLHDDQLDETAQAILTLDDAGSVEGVMRWL